MARPSSQPERTRFACPSASTLPHHPWVEGAPGGWCLRPWPGAGKSGRGNSGDGLHGRVHVLASSFWGLVDRADDNVQRRWPVHGVDVQLREDQEPFPPNGPKTSSMTLCRAPFIPSARVDRNVVDTTFDGRASWSEFISAFERMGRRDRWPGCPGSCAAPPPPRQGGCSLGKAVVQQVVVVWHDVSADLAGGEDLLSTRRSAFRQEFSDALNGRCSSLPSAGAG